MNTDAPTVLSELLHWRVQQHPDKLFASFVNGTQWTYAQTWQQAQSAASGLQALGVQPGDCVFTWLPSGADFIRTWFGINLTGAIHAPCNLAWRGRMLEHAIQTSGAKIAVVHRDLLARMAEVNLHTIEQVVVVGGACDIALPVLCLGSDALESRNVPSLPATQPWDTMQMLFTSGTTGASKAVLSSYTHAAHFLDAPIPNTFGPDAVFLLVLPLFHAGGLTSVYSVLRDGGSVVIPHSFRTDAFWQWVNEYQVTSTTIVEQMAVFLLNQPPSEADRNHTMRITNIAPMGSAAYRFEQRFGVQLWTSYGSTEIGAPICSDAQPQRRGTTGRVRDGYEVRIVDEHDMEVPHGTSGELVVRTNQPWHLCSGYRGNDSATASAWRNGWFHTGDMFRRDEQGWFHFMDRKKDAIRRRGENISCYEVEQEVLAHPHVAQVVAYPVPLTSSEDEVMVCVVTHPEQTGESPDWTALVQFLRERAPHYMVPRYFRAVSALPLTETGKVRKALLREEGITADTWDRQDAGIAVKSERIGQ